MSEMIERVARALYDANEFKRPWDHKDTEKVGWHRIYRKQARAAIEAMREPTENMMISGLVAGSEANKPFTERIKEKTEGFCASLVTAGNGAIYKSAYQAMIDEALK